MQAKKKQWKSDLVPKRAPKNHANAPTTSGPNSSTNRHEADPKSLFFRDPKRCVIGIFWNPQIDTDVTVATQFDAQFGSSLRVSALENANFAYLRDQPSIRDRFARNWS